MKENRNFNVNNINEESTNAKIISKKFIGLNLLVDL